MTTVNSRHLSGALRACARGLYPLEAGTGLLIDCGSWLHRDDFTSRFITTGPSISDGVTLLLAATLSAHRSAPFGVHVLAGFAGDEGSGLAVTGAGEEAGERVDGVEQERVDLGLLIGGVLGAVAAGKAVPLCGLLLLVLGGLVSGLISGLPPAQCLGAGQAAGGGLRVSAGRLVSRG
jgi:hypothetical protein